MLGQHDRGLRGKIARGGGCRGDGGLDQGELMDPFPIADEGPDSGHAGGGKTIIDRDEILLRTIGKLDEEGFPGWGNLTRERPSHAA